MSGRKLIVNADDFGFTRDVNEGIIEAHQRGVLTATTLMASGAAFEHAVALARRNPELDVGCHLALVGEPPLAASVAGLIRAIALGRIRIYEELAAQVSRILDAGIRPTHIDTHKHTHLVPRVLEAVARISREFGIPWVRLPFDFAPRGAAHMLRLWRPHVRRTLLRHGCRVTDHFAGYALTGRLDTAELVRLIHRLPAGTTELMCHPGHSTSELRAAPTRLKESRERELLALTAPETRQALGEAGVDLARYRDL
ncbi:MAG: ChbG/HpnK family deacetylase [Acidobacteriota bacterium]